MTLGAAKVMELVLGEPLHQIIRSRATRSDLIFLKNVGVFLGTGCLIRLIQAQVSHGKTRLAFLRMPKGQTSRIEPTGQLHLWLEVCTRGGIRRCSRRLGDFRTEEAKLGLS